LLELRPVGAAPGAEPEAAGAFGGDWKSIMTTAAGFCPSWLVFDLPDPLGRLLELARDLEPALFIDVQHSPRET
jgi:hypothetical protein